MPAALLYCMFERTDCMRFLLWGVQLRIRCTVQMVKTGKMGDSVYSVSLRMLQYIYKLTDTNKMFVLCFFFFIQILNFAVKEKPLITKQLIKAQPPKASIIQPDSLLFQVIAFAWLVCLKHLSSCFFKWAASFSCLPSFPALPPLCLDTCLPSQEKLKPSRTAVQSGCSYCLQVFMLMPAASCGFDSSYLNHHCIRRHFCTCKVEKYPIVWVWFWWSAIWSWRDEVKRRIHDMSCF